MNYFKFWPFAWICMKLNIATESFYCYFTINQVFESNKESGKLYKMKLGKGKVIKVCEICLTDFGMSQILNSCEKLK